MTPSDPGDAGNPFQSLLGDLMNMLGSNGPDQWEMTRSFALNVATGGTPESNVEPLQRIQVEQLSRVAELNVMEVTGLPVTPDGRRLTCVPVGRGDWTVRALESWRPVLSALAAPPPAAPETAPAPTGAPGLDPLDDDPTGGMAAMLGQWASAIGPMFLGLQIGSVVGHLAQRTLDGTVPTHAAIRRMTDIEIRWPYRGRRPTSSCSSRPTSPSSPPTGACPRRRRSCGCAPGSWRPTPS